MAGPGISAKVAVVIAKARYNSMSERLRSGHRNHRRDLAVDRTFAVRKACDHAGAILELPVLAHLALGVDTRDRDAQTNDAAQLRSNEIGGCIAHLPGFRARTLVQIGE